MLAFDSNAKIEPFYTKNDKINKLINFSFKKKQTIL